MFPLQVVKVDSYTEVQTIVGYIQQREEEMSSLAGEEEEVIVAEPPPAATGDLKASGWEISSMLLLLLHLIDLDCSGCNTTVVIIRLLHNLILICHTVLNREQLS